ADLGRSVRRAGCENAALRPAARRLHLRREAAAAIEEEEEPDAAEAVEVGERGAVGGLDLEHALTAGDGAWPGPRARAPLPRRARPADDVDLERFPRDASQPMPHGAPVADLAQDDERTLVAVAIPRSEADRRSRRADRGRETAQPLQSGANAHRGEL